jgi:hypothetical protein
MLDDDRSALRAGRTSIRYSVANFLLSVASMAVDGHLVGDNSTVSTSNGASSIRSDRLARNSLGTLAPLGHISFTE